MAAVASTPLTPFGAEVDLDLAAAMSPAAEAALRDLLRDHKLLVFHDQRIDMARQVEVMRLFGDVIDHEPDSTHISNQSAADGLGPLKLTFHSDLSFSPEPYRVMSLAGLELEDGRSSTFFAHAGRACAALPPGTRDRLASLTALNVFSRKVDGRNREAELEPGDPWIIGPVVRDHPVTGEPVLWVNENATDRIVDLPDDESEALVQQMFAALYDDGNVQEHVWRRGDLLLWDNLALQHARNDVSGVGTRILQKVVCGPAGFLDQHPEFGRADFTSRPEAQV